MSLLPFQHISIIGLGLIGGSLAMAIKSRFPDIRLQGIDPSEETLQYALKSNVVDEVSLSLPETFADNHLIVIACHLKQSLEVLRSLAPRVQNKSIIVSDIGSCKRKICALGDDLLPGQFIGGHPMAGRETSGIQNATSLMFSDKRYLLCPSDKTPSEALAKLETLISGIGSHIRHIDPDTHDRIMAYVSHFPQLYATLLAGVLKNNKPSQLMQYQGAGLDDQMRLAGSPYAMWQDVFEQNADNVAEVLAQFGQAVEAARQSLTSGKVVDLSDTFANANAIYQSWLDFKQSPMVINNR